MTSIPPTPLSSINPAAGIHDIPGDPAELAAALGAAERTWREFPYYGLRYGERGRRFADSDSAWIATLPSLDQAEVIRQVLWLARVLAARGQPSLLLDHHLRNLHEELCRAHPDKATVYRLLLGAAEHLAHLRNQQFPPEQFNRMRLEFEQTVGPALAAQHPTMGTLLVAAVADGANGLPNALGSMLEWLCDPQRFPPEWVAAVSLCLKRWGVQAG